MTPRQPSDHNQAGPMGGVGRMMDEALDLEAIEARANAATEGPWHWEPPSSDPWPNADESLTNESGESILLGWGYEVDGIEGKPWDREFIAHAREDVPALIAEVRRLQSVVEDCQRWATTHECGD